MLHTCGLTDTAQEFIVLCEQVVMFSDHQRSSSRYSKQKCGTDILGSFPPPSWSLVCLAVTATHLGAQSISNELVVNDLPSFNAV